MKKLHNIICLAAICFIVTNAKAQDAKQQAMMKTMTDYMTPGESQKMMSKSAGDWKAVVTTMMDPTKPPTKTDASVHNEMILGGRYLTTHYTGQMMGMPFEGLGTIAYDNGRKIYIETWIDNMGTGITYMEGTASPDGRSIEFKGEGYDPTQGKMVKMRQVLTFNDDNNQTLQMFQDMNGKETRVMEIHMSR